MADTRGMQDLFGLDIDKLAKGFGSQIYNFLAEVQVAKMKGDSIRWFQKTAGTLSATSPSVTSGVSPGARPTTLEVSWTRNTSYKKTFFVEGFLDDEDIDDAEIDTFATTIRDLTEVIVRDRDAHLWDIMSEGQSASEIQTFATTAQGGDQWDAANYAADIIVDLMHAKKLIRDQGYDPEGASLLLDTTGYKSLVTWLISGKGSSIPGFSSEKINTGVVLNILNLNVKVSLNVTTDFALVIVPKRAVTYRESKGITATTDVDSQIGRNIRVKASGIAFRTDPKAIVLITDINTA
ncbi:hypothetical protein LCGC14_1999990 [marine sediment metagenome]|uniref:Uncharacterized protein n=1 Tax=marine sediment metagenome TaxID=412755 RepID=A0A0F9HGY7_9ZZZZ